MRQALVRAVRSRGVDVVTALEADMIEPWDAHPLEDATAPGRVVERCNVGDVYQAVEEQWEKASAQVRQLLHALRPYEPECVYLFGSWARGEADALSDLDVVLIKHTTQPFFERLREARRLVPAALGGVDLLVYTPEEFAAMLRAGNAFAEMIVEEGCLLYGRHAAR